MKNFTKDDFICELCDSFEFTKFKAKEIFEKFQDIILQKTFYGMAVCFDRLGKFKNVTRKARKARNIKTGEIINVEEKTILHFKRKK